MDLSLKSVTWHCIEKIGAYTESIPQSDIKFHATEIYHLTVAKQSLLRAIISSETKSHDLYAHKLARLYEDQLAKLKEKYGI
jgi:hypothetical protein